MASPLQNDAFPTGNRNLCVRDVPQGGATQSAAYDTALFVCVHHGVKLFQVFGEFWKSSVVIQDQGRDALRSEGNERTTDLAGGTWLGWWHKLAQTGAARRSGGDSRASASAAAVPHPYGQGLPSHVVVGETGNEPNKNPGRGRMLTFTTTVMVMVMELMVGVKQQSSKSELSRAAAQIEFC